MDGRRPPTEANEHAALDINTAWLESVELAAAMSFERKPRAKPTIFRVPPSVRCRNQRAYDEPNVVSIGPYHRGKSKDLMAMEEIKRRLLHDYLCKVPNGSNNEGLRKMKDLEKRARDCYREVIDLDSGEFLEMLLLDGCFLVQIFIAFEDRDLLAESVSHNIWISRLMSRDFLLLENQIPYFIVEHLLDMPGMPEWNSSRLQKVALKNLAVFLPGIEYRRPDLPVETFQVDHLLHSFHKWIVPNLEEVSNTRCCNKPSLEPFCPALSPIIDKAGDCLSKVLRCHSNSSHPEIFPASIPGVTQLVQAGVKMEARKAK